MGRGVAENVQTLVRVQGDDRKVAVLINRSVQIAQLAVEAHGYSRLCETGPDRLRNLEASDVIGVLDDLSVR
jgi:hypothetical protein